MSDLAAARPRSNDAALQEARHQLGELRKRADLATTMTLLVGAAALVLLAVYFSFGLRLIDDFSQPDQLVALGSQLIDEKIPEARAALEQQVTAQAPTWAEGLSRQALDAMPGARGRLEKFAMEQVDQALEKGAVMTEERFKEFIQQNRNELMSCMNDLATSPKLTEEHLVGLQQALEKEVRGDVERTFHDADDMLSLINQKLARLRNVEGLTEGERIERKVLVLARRIQERNVPMPSARVEAPAAERGDNPTPEPPRDAAPPASNGPDPASKLDPAEEQPSEEPKPEPEPAPEPDPAAEEPKPEAEPAPPAEEPKPEPTPAEEPKPNTNP